MQVRGGGLRHTMLPPMTDQQPINEQNTWPRRAGGRVFEDLQRHHRRLGEPVGVEARCEKRPVDAASAGTREPLIAQGHPAVRRYRLRVRHRHGRRLGRAGQRDKDRREHQRDGTLMTRGTAARVLTPGGNVSQEGSRRLPGRVRTEAHAPWRMLRRCRWSSKGFFFDREMEPLHKKSHHDLIMTFSNVLGRSEKGRSCVPFAPLVLHRSNRFASSSVKAGRFFWGGGYRGSLPGTVTASPLVTAGQAQSHRPCYRR